MKQIKDKDNHGQTLKFSGVSKLSCLYLYTQDKNISREVVKGSESCIVREAV